MLQITLKLNIERNTIKFSFIIIYEITQIIIDNIMKILRIYTIMI